MFQYLSSQSLVTQHTGPKKNQGMFSSVRTAVLRGCNSVLSEFQKYYIIQRMKVDFSKHKGSSQLNGIFLAIVLRWMLEGKNKRLWISSFSLYLFRFVFGYIDTWMGFQDESPPTNIHDQYTYIVNRLISNNYSTWWSKDDVEEMSSSIRQFKKSMWRLFSSHCEQRLNTLKFHLLDHLVDDLDRFGAFLVLAPPRMNT